MRGGEGGKGGVGGLQNEFSMLDLRGAAGDDRRG